MLMEDFESMRGVTRGWMVTRFAVQKCTAFLVSHFIAAAHQPAIIHTTDTTFISQLIFTPLIRPLRIGKNQIAKPDRRSAPETQQESGQDSDSILLCLYRELARILAANGYNVKDRPRLNAVLCCVLPILLTDKTCGHPSSMAG